MRHCLRVAPPARPLSTLQAAAPRTLRNALSLALLLAGAMPADAGPLADPTRPAITANPGAATPPGARSVPAARASAPVAAPVPEPQLQAVHLPAQGAPQALVDGRLVKAGDLVGGRKVLAIDSQCLLLAGRGGDERLWLLGGARKQAAGSIVITRTASFVPAPAASDPAAAEPRPQLDRGSAATSSPAPNTPLAVAGRTSP